MNVGLSVLVHELVLVHSVRAAGTGIMPWSSRRLRSSSNTGRGVCRGGRVHT